MIDAASGDAPASLRNRAILLLLSVYGLRSGEVRRWQLDDVDWQHDRLRIQRSKSLRFAMCPREPSVGNALAGYVRHGRPPSHSRTLCLTLRAPSRTLSAGALRRLVRRYLAIVGKAMAQTGCATPVPVICSKLAIAARRSGTTWGIGVQTVRVSMSRSICRPYVSWPSTT